MEQLMLKNDTELRMFIDRNISSVLEEKYEDAKALSKDTYQYIQIIKPYNNEDSIDSFLNYLSMFQTNLLITSSSIKNTAFGNNCSFDIFEELIKSDKLKLEQAILHLEDALDEACKLNPLLKDLYEITGSNGVLTRVDKIKNEVYTTFQKLEDFIEEGSEAQQTYKKIMMSFDIDKLLSSFNIAPNVKAILNNVKRYDDEGAPNEQLLLMAAHKIYFSVSEAMIEKFVNNQALNHYIDKVRNDIQNYFGNHNDEMMEYLNAL